MNAETETREGGAEAAAKAPNSRAPPWTQGTEYQGTKDSSRALESHGTCTAGFQTCFGPVIHSFIPPIPFLLD